MLCELDDRELPEDSALFFNWFNSFVVELIVEIEELALFLCG